MGLKIDRVENKEKNKIIDNAIIQLKKEFIGIDEQIDSIMNNVRVWFLYPQLQTSPCIVNVFGMTGCGKTSLIRRISQLLGLEKNLVYFNFCAINEMTSWEIENDIEEQLDNECSNRIFVYDEFQYAATLDPTEGVEKDNRNGLKPFWELLDTGILHKRNSFHELRQLYKAISYMSKINTKTAMDIKDGVWVNGEECIVDLSRRELDEMIHIFDIPSNKIDRIGDSIEEDITDEEVLKKPFFLSNGFMSKLTEIYRKVNNLVLDKNDLYDMLSGMDSSEILDMLVNTYEKAQVGYDLKFTDSIIFVVANVDEAYDMAFNVNPDMSPDQFYSLTKKINIVDIKKALQKRFRNEQIARLGNIHIIYPSFNSSSFKKIINLNLDKYREKAKEICGLDMVFDESIHKLIYDESVFPTQGTRPIFSSIHELIKTKLPYIVQNICSDGLDFDVEAVSYSYKRGKTIISLLNYDGGVIRSYSFKDNLRLNKLREATKDEQQANTAVHESGHFVIYSYLNGRIPEKIISKSAESDIEGFMMHDADSDDKLVWSRQDYLNHIKVALGGYVAEGLIFGEDRRSSGASGDLKVATVTASKMVRDWGMEGLPYVTTHLNDVGQGGGLVKEEDQSYINEQIKTIVNQCLNDTLLIMKKPHIMNMLKKSSKYLANNSSISKKMMTDLFDEAKENGGMCENNETYYRDIVNNF